MQPEKKTRNSELNCRLRLPGFGLPVYHDVDHRFPSAVRLDWWSQGVTVREQRMMAFIGDITDDPGWELRILDEEIVDKWRAEADTRPANLEGDVVLSKDMFDFCIKELRDKAAIFNKTGLVNILDGELAVVKSDLAVSESVRSALCQGVRPLEDVPDRLKDWHPRSDGLVLDLVHPSLFPVAYGLTRMLPDEKVPLDGCIGYTGKGTTMDAFTPGSSDNELEWSSFQWLPTDVRLTDSGAKVQGYINNLHPEKHRDLYEILEDVVTATVPLWEECLSGFGENLRIPLGHTGKEDWTYPEGLRYRIPGREEGQKAWYNPKNDEVGDGRGPDDIASKYDYDEDWEWQAGRDYQDWDSEHRILIHREPCEYKSQAELRADGANPINFKQDYPEGLQVIFKLANIHLSPEKPTYDGRPWQVEGGLNESICASAIYYFDQENITESHLAFRQSMDTGDITMMTSQDEYDSMEAYLDVEEGGPSVQRLGQVLTRKGRLLVFPNCLQHQVQSFSLRDETRPGYRKILAMFLIDPERRLLSTSNVPPQRRDWWAEELYKKKALKGMPAELEQQIVGLVDEFPVSWDKAVEMRETLMDERSSGNEKVSNQMLSYEIFFLSLSEIEHMGFTHSMAICLYEKGDI